MDGNDGRVEVPHVDSLAFGNTDSYTLSVWVNVLTVPGHWAGIVNKSRDIGPEHYGLWINGSNQWVFGGDNIIGSGVQADGWHSMVLVQDGAANTRTLYVDGDVDVTGTAIGPNGVGDLWMGGAKSVNEFLHGKIDDVAIFGRALTQEDVKALADGSNIMETAVEPYAKQETTWASIKMR